MSVFTSLKPLFESKTIAPTYKLSHILDTFFFLGKSPQGVGRYRIKDEIGLGEGSTKTLLTRLKDENFISIETKKQLGHSLTPKGLEIFNQLIQIIPIPIELNNLHNKFVVGEFAYFSHLSKKNLKEHLEIGIAQRDEAIKIGGTGASVLTYHNNQFSFPDNFQIQLPILIENVHEGDLIVIGGGKTKNLAVLSTIAASLSLISIN